jgi:hypothetical protein
MDASQAQPVESAQRPRPFFASAMAVLFVILAVSDFTKPLQYANNPDRGGLVILGHRILGVLPNAVAGTLFGLFLLTYAWGLWKMRRWVLPISIAYAFYVPVNLVMFWFLHTDGRPSVRFIAMYLAISLIGSVGTAIYLAYNRDWLS